MNSNNRTRGYYTPVEEEPTPVKTVEFSHTIYIGDEGYVILFNKVGTRYFINGMMGNKSVLIVTDNDHVWFKQYILTNINKKKLGRPYLPFYSFDSFNSNIDDIKTENDIQLIHDMLQNSFPNGYFFWYIGKSQSMRANLAKMSKQPLLWLMDEELSNSFYLDSNDPALDIRLLNMYRLFNKTLEAVLFAQIDIEK